MMTAMAILGVFVAGFGFGLFVAIIIQRRDTRAFTVAPNLTFTGIATPESVVRAFKDAQARGVLR